MYDDWNGTMQDRIPVYLFQSLSSDNTHCQPLIYHLILHLFTLMFCGETYILQRVEMKKSFNFVYPIEI